MCDGLLSAHASQGGESQSGGGSEMKETEEGGCTGPRTQEGGHLNVYERRLQSVHYGEKP